jgi:hypothetical protein
MSSLATWPIANASTVASVCAMPMGRSVRNADGPFIVEQRAYFDVGNDGRIARMHVICSGYQPNLDQAVSAGGRL